MFEASLAKHDNEFTFSFGTNIQNLNPNFDSNNQNLSASFSQEQNTVQSSFKNINHNVSTTFHQNNHNFNSDFELGTGGSGIILPIGGKYGDLLAKGAGDLMWVTPADSAEEDNTRPITAAAVYTEIGNINALLATI